MAAVGFISKKLAFKGRIALAATAISSFVMIVAVSVSAGFRKEIRAAVQEHCADVSVSGIHADIYSGSAPVTVNDSILSTISSIPGVLSVDPVIWRAGIVRNGDLLEGVLFKGTEDFAGDKLEIRISSSLASKIGCSEGDRLLSYFVGDLIKARQWKVTLVEEDATRIDDKMQVVCCRAADLRRLAGWSADQASAIEVRLDERFSSRSEIDAKAQEIGASIYGIQGSEDLLASSSASRYHVLFDWLDLIDTNVAAILFLMAIVAAFNMISALLILIMRNTSTIGSLKAMGMSDAGIAGIFLMVASRAIALGLAIGNVLAIGFCHIEDATHFFKLNPANYFVPYVPVRVNIPVILAVDVAAWAVIMLILLLPARYISRIDPAKTIKTE